MMEVMKAVYSAAEETKKSMKNSSATGERYTFYSFFFASALGHQVIFSNILYS